MAVNEQFNQGHFPLKPLPYKLRDKACTSEFMIDYGSTGEESFHMYITDSNDPSKIYDLTQIMLEEIFPKAGIDANKFTVKIDGEEEEIFLKDIISFIYKRFIYTESLGVFNYERDRYKIINAERKDSLLRDLDGNVITPITLADNVLFHDGSTLQDKDSSITRMTISRQLFHIEEGVYTLIGEYPINNFDGYMEVRLNGIPMVLDEEYTVTNIDSNKFVVSFNENIIYITDHDIIECIYCYNTLQNPDLRNAIDGQHIANKTIPATKLQKVTDSIYNRDSNTIASARSVNNLFNTITDILDLQSDNVVYCLDKSSYNTYIHIDHIHDITALKYCVVNVLLKTNKRYDCEVLVHYKGDAKTRVALKDMEDNDINCSLPAGRVLKMIWDKDSNCFRAIMPNINQLRVNKLVHKCYDSEEKICYCEMEYNAGAAITVYKNGLRLFEDIDYAIDYVEQTITLFTPAEASDLIVFEALSL